MPIYVYKCATCAKNAEVWKKHSEMNREEHCDVCGSEMVRVLTPSNFHLKGSGWYVTDYKSTQQTKPDGSS